MEDIPYHALDAILCRYFGEIRSRLATRKFGCHAALVGPLSKKTLAETTVFCETVNLQTQGNNLEQKQENYERRVTKSEKMLPILYLV